MTLRQGSVRAGYKRTEVGILPEDWSASSIDEMVAKVGSGITPTGGEKVYTKEGRPFLRSQNVGLGELLLDDIAYITDETHKTFPATEICSGDVFLNITGASIGRSTLTTLKKPVTPCKTGIGNRYGVLAVNT